MASLQSWLAASVGVTLAAIAHASVGAATPPPDRGASATVRLLDVPYVPQSEALCGGAALAMVLRYWGEPGVLAEDFSTLIEREAAGIRTDDLVSAVRGRGWTALPFTGTSSNVREQLTQGRPVVALIGAGSGSYHYVVLVAWANGGVIIHDPAVAPYRTKSEQAFDDAWARSGRWALLVLPPRRADDAAGSDSTHSNAAESDSIDGCDAIVEDAIRRAREGDTAEAERRLLSADALCLDSAAPLRALAGLRFKVEDWAGAARFAERALARGPSDPYTWRLLAGSRFLMGDEVGALRAWNEISEPRADLTRVDGLDRIRYRAVADQLVLPPGQLLSSGAFVRARRRLAEMPAQLEARLSLRPLPQGSAQVNVALVERPLFFDGPLDAGGAGVRAVTEREVLLRIGSPTGNGELWTARYSWRQERPRASLALAAPSPGRRPGIWRVEAFWERQAYAGPASEDPNGMASSSVIREERRRTALALSDWISSNLRLEGGAALDKWSGRGTYLSFESKIEARLAGDRLALSARVAHWTSLESGVPFEQGDLSAQWSAKHLDLGGWIARAGVTSTSSEAPWALWSGAGTGRGRAPLLRAHPLLFDGVVAGRTFGRTLFHTGVERLAWACTLKSLRVGWSVFVDGAKPWDTLRSVPVPFQVDGGASIRLSGLGARNEVRITAARGFEDGSAAFTIGWEVR